MIANTTLWVRTIGKAGRFGFLALIAAVGTAGCNSNITSKLVATRVVIPQENGRDFDKEGVKVSVLPGTFSGPVEMDVEGTTRGVKISTVTANGAKVLSADVLKCPVRARVSQEWPKIRIG